VVKNWDDRETLFTDLGAFEDFKPVLSKSNQNHSHIFLANIHPDLQQLVIDQSLNSSKIIAIDTMNLWIDIAKDSLHNVLSSSDILFINESEASLLSGKKTIYDSASLFLDLGLKIVVVKKGGQGAELFSNEENIKIGAYKVNVVDPTGAGDVFGGAFISTLAQGGTLSDSLVNGSAMASFCVEGFGTSCILNVSEEELEDRKSNLYSTLSS
jgi:sugar/nucleoside kinase (ribokinase family)